MIDTKRPIHRSRHQRMLGGVLGGLAEWLGWDPSVARVAYILLTVFTGFALGAVAYVILWLFVPLEDPPFLRNGSEAVGANARTHS